MGSGWGVVWSVRGQINGNRGLRGYILYYWLQTALALPCLYRPTLRQGREREHGGGRRCGARVAAGASPRVSCSAPCSLLLVRCASVRVLRRRSTHDGDGLKLKIVNRLHVCIFKWHLRVCVYMCV